MFFLAEKICAGILHNPSQAILCLFKKDCLVSMLCNRCCGGAKILTGDVIFFAGIVINLITKDGISDSDGIIYLPPYFLLQKSYLYLS